MKTWFVLIVAAFLFFSGCQKDETILPMDELAMISANDKTVTIGEEIFLLMYESVTIVPDGFSITFDAVPEDSRCPRGAVCIWEGRAVIKLTIENREACHEIFLETPNSQQSQGPAVNLFGRTIKLLLVAPYPNATHQITDKEYRIVLVVKELEQLVDHF